MYSMILCLFFCVLNTVYTSPTVLVNKKNYTLENASFVLFEMKPNVIVINEYLAFYSDEEIPLSKFMMMMIIYVRKSTIYYFPDSKITSNTHVCGYTIGEYENFYPVTQLKSKMYCGRFSVKEMMGYNRSITYRNYWWQDAESFLSDMQDTLLTDLNDQICFVY